MDALLLYCAVVALASHGSAQGSPGYVSAERGYEPTTHRQRDRAADDWLGSSVRDDSLYIIVQSSRNIQRVPRAAFRNTPSVDSMFVNNNSISEVDVGAFEGVPKLGLLDLDYNDISTLSEAVFSPVPRLTFLFLSGNRIAELSPGHFAGLPRLFRLELNNNRVQLQLHNRTFANLPSLWEIHLSNSNIRTLPRDVFVDSNGLTYIYLNDNKIEELDNSIFYGLTKLVKLNLSGNRLQTLQPAVFNELRSLETLDLSYNRISYLSEENMHFRWSPRVDLTNNMIQYFHPHLYNNNRRTPTFILNNNPYHCSCSLLSFTQKYSKKDIQLPRLEISRAICDAPAHLRGTALSQLSEDSLADCDTTPSNTLADSVTTTKVPEAASTEIPTLSSEYPDTPTSDSTWPTPRPEEATVTETPEHSSFTTPPILSSTSST